MLAELRSREDMAIALRREIASEFIGRSCERRGDGTLMFHTQALIAVLESAGYAPNEYPASFGRPQQRSLSLSAWL